MLSNVLAAYDRHFVGRPAHPKVISLADGLSVRLSDGESFEIQAVYDVRFKNTYIIISFF